MKTHLFISTFWIKKCEESGKCVLDRLDSLFAYSSKKGIKTGRLRFNQNTHTKKRILYLYLYFIYEYYICIYSKKLKMTTNLQ